jgi:hypothetical protein
MDDKPTSTGNVVSTGREARHHQTEGKTMNEATEALAKAYTFSRSLVINHGIVQARIDMTRIEDALRALHPDIDLDFDAIYKARMSA